jgi:integrase
MAWKRDKLTDLAIRRSKPTAKLRKLSDGKGLQLWITPKNGRYWRWEYRFLGKRKLLAIGTYPEITVEQARLTADYARSQLRENIDPSRAKQEKKAALKITAENTFSKIAEKLIEKKRKEGKAQVTIEKLEWILEKVADKLGDEPVAAIRTPLVITCLRREEERGNLETARRMRTVIGEVFRFAMQHGLVEGDPSAATKGATAAPKPVHHAAITDPIQFGALLKKLDEFETQSPLTGAALKLMSLLYPRPGELRFADWTEFDLERAIWSIPAARMKMRKKHEKPLSRQAVEILGRLKEITGPKGFLFPANGKPGRPMSENTMNSALRRLGIAQSTHSSHGFRATASTLLNASNLFSIDAIERSLAHQDSDAVRRAYARGDAMQERQKMAQWWSDYLDRLRKPETDNVISIKAGRS